MQYARKRPWTLLWLCSNDPGHYSGSAATTLMQRHLGKARGGSSVCIVRRAGPIVHMAGLASQMKRYCDCCKRYADHLDGKMRCFRRRMTTNFRDGMVIPNKFINHFGGKISRTIELESRNGSMYTVEVSKRNSPPAAWMGCISRCASRRGERLATVSPHSELAFRGEDSDSEAEEHSEDESSFGLDDDRQTPCAGRDYVLSRSGRLSGAEEERVTRLLQDVRAETRVFVAIMKMNTRNCAIVIPKLFAEEHFPRESRNLTLQRPGKSKSWHPWFCVRKDQCGHTLYGTRWLGFLRDNDVQEGDLCP
ncbi:Arginyl-tRNA synthetase [Hordeum vulgare]|nr:Arginyl-tRNA synthetase [Hordeum vulgare]